MKAKLTYEELEQRVSELENQTAPKAVSDILTPTLCELSQSLNATSDADKAYKSIYTALNQITGLTDFYIAFCQTGTNKSSFPFLVRKENIFYNCRDNISHAHILARTVLKAEKTLLLKGSQLKKILPSDSMDIRKEVPMAKAFVGIPLKSGHKILGILAALNGDDPDYFTPKMVEILNTVANQLSLFLSRKYYLDQLDILQNYLFNIINSMPSILIVVDKNLIITQWNLQAELETGVIETDAKGQLLKNVFPRISKYMKLIEESIQFNRIKTRLRQNYFTRTETRYEDVIIYPLITKKVDGLVIRMDDITEQVRLEEMMIQSEKMLSVGGLAAGMAHEINNPLAGMMQNAQVIHHRLEKNIPANITAASESGMTMENLRAYAKKRQIFDRLEMINETGTRAAEIINSMLGFARKSDTLFKSHHLPQILKRTLELAKSDYNLKKQYDFTQIEIIEEFDQDMPPVPCDKNKLEQVFFNLLKNGAEAMFNENKTPFSPQFIFRLYRENNMACIEIENNGPPVNEDEQKRLFEPFFTTKPVGQGTGLGLSLSYFIVVKDHKGEMTVESSPEENTKFIIKLPY